MSKILEGGCLCGQIRYTMPDPMIAAVCHCSHCQRQSGSAFSFNLGVPLKKVDLQGNLKVFKDQGENGLGVERHFCPDCGSPIMSLLESAPGFAIMKGGTLDDSSGIAPQFQVWTRSALSWSSPAYSTPCYEMQAPTK